MTVTWEFDHSGSPEEARNEALRLADDIIHPAPQGDSYRSYGIKVEVAKKERAPVPLRLAEFPSEEVFGWIDSGETFRMVRVKGRSYQVRLGSDRFQLFRRSPQCAACSLAGSKFFLESDPASGIARFQFYGVEAGRLVLMTKDHQRARAYGGADTLDNFVTLCDPCNQVKGSYPLSYPSVKVLRDLMRNPDRLPAGELKERVRRQRLLLMDCLNGQ